jgi:hypothetical protein
MKKAILSIVLAVLLLGTAPIAMATLNSNSIVEDGIEYYVQTNKPVYNLGENVEMLYRVTNLRSEDVVFYLPNSPAWNFWVEKDGENIWTAVEGWYTVSSGFTLAPSEFKEFPVFSPYYVWDMRNNENNLINVGEYDVIGGFDAGAAENYYYSRVSVPITIVPEPCSLAFLLASMVYFIKKRRT